MGLAGSGQTLNKCKDYFIANWLQMDIHPGSKDWVIFQHFPGQLAPYSQEVGNSHPFPKNSTGYSVVCSQLEDQVPGMPLQPVSPSHAELSRVPSSATCRCSWGGLGQHPGLGQLLL